MYNSWGPYVNTIPKEAKYIITIIMKSSLKSKDLRDLCIYF
jgi:hypothetical protein